MTLPPQSSTALGSLPPKKGSQEQKLFAGESSIIKPAWTCVMTLAPGTGTSVRCPLIRSAQGCGSLLAPMLDPFPQTWRARLSNMVATVVFEHLAMQARHGFSFSFTPATFHELKSECAAHGFCTRFRTFRHHKRSR